MTRPPETPGHGRRFSRGTRDARSTRVMVALTAAGLAAASAMVWSGVSAVATVNAVNTANAVNAGTSVDAGNAGPRAGQLPPSARPVEAPTGARPGPSATKDATKDATTPGNAAKLGPIPPAPTGPQANAGAGNAPEVSLAEAGRAESGAASSRPEGGNSTGLKLRGPVDPAAVLSDASVSLGGCLPQYGAAGQCLPAVPPSLSRHLKEMMDAGLDPGSMPHSWTCAEVRAYFKNGLAVRQAHNDPQRLDANHDGVACGAAD